MPSPIGHVIAGVAAGWLVGGPPPRSSRAGSLRATVPAAGRAHMPVGVWREAALFGALAALPDLDLLAGAHSGPTHSLGAAALVGMTAWAIGRLLGARRAGRLALACAAAYASHVLLDWLGSDSSPPLGVMALWPASRAHYESQLHVFMAISRRYAQGRTFIVQNLYAVALELVVLVPILGLVMLLRPRRVELRNSDRGV